MDVGDLGDVGDEGDVVGDVWDMGDEGDVKNVEIRDSSPPPISLLLIESFPY